MGEESSGRKAVQLTDLPDSLLLDILFYLGAEDLACLARTCSRFSRITQDKLLWRRVFHQRFKVPYSVPMRPGTESWQSEYRRLCEETPAILCEELTKHRDQVLHVRFSHSGEMFSTCSKDGKVLVWNSDSPCTLRFSVNMSEKFNWRYTQFSEFNKTDTLLLVSGVFHGNMTTSGEIAVFDLTDFEVQCRVVNKPYDVFGCWYNNLHLFSGTLYWTGHLQSVSALWLNKASQEVESEKESVMMNLYRFSNVNASSIRTVMVADVPILNENADASIAETTTEMEETTMEMEEEFSTFASQNGEDYSDCEEDNRNNSCNEVFRYHSTKDVEGEWGEGDCLVDCLVMDLDTTANGNILENASSSLQLCSSSTEGKRATLKRSGDAGSSGRKGGGSARHFLTGSTRYHNGEDVQVIASVSESVRPPSTSALSSPFGCCCSAKESASVLTAHQKNSKGTTPVQEASSVKPDLLHSSGWKTVNVNGERLCGSDTSSSSSLSMGSFDSSPTTETPSRDVHKSPQKHALDIPRLSASAPQSHRMVRTEKLLIFTMGNETYTPHLIGFKRIELKDIVGEGEAQRAMAEGDDDGDEDRVLLPNVEHNQQGMNIPPTMVDHTINLKGHIIGMALSPDHRYLYVNSRQWPENYHIEAVLEPPPIAQEIDIHVIDLVTMQEMGTVMRSHRAFTPNDECFFIFLDVSENYVASGAEDRQGYLWDRHYGVHLHCFPHNDVVNSVAFNPHDQEMLITVSDDNTIKIWRSRRQMRKLKQQHRCVPHQKPNSSNS